MRSQFAPYIALMRDPDPDRGLAASREALALGLVLISLETVEAKGGWLFRERVERLMRGFLDELEAHRGTSGRPGGVP
jgi:hypothetical protein